MAKSFVVAFERNLTDTSGDMIPNSVEAFPIIKGIVTLQKTDAGFTGNVTIKILDSETGLPFEGLTSVDVAPDSSIVIGMSGGGPA